MLEFQNIRTFLLKDILQIGRKKFFFVSQIKNTVPWTYVINDLSREEITGIFYEKKLKKTSRENFRIKKHLKEKVISCMSHGKVMVIVLIVGLIKKTLNEIL